MPTATFFRLHDEKQEKVMRAAIHEFIEHGFQRAKISDIARSGGVAKGSIYQYFADKKELFIYCAEWGLKVFMEKLDQRTNIGDMDVFEYFQQNAGKTAVLTEEHELTVFMQLIEREPELADESMKAMYQIGDVYGKKLIENSRNRGLIRTDIDDELLMEFFLGVSERFKMRWMRRYIDFTAEVTSTQNEELKKELEQMLKLLKNGMGC